MSYTETRPETFFTFYEAARADVAKRVGDATSPTDELRAVHPEARWFVAPDHCSGFGVDPDGTLLGVWSVVRGRGNALLDAAKWRGAVKLWCFDGYLRTFYENAGFCVVKREPNWTAGAPDVLHMVLS